MNQTQDTEDQRGTEVRGFIPGEKAALVTGARELQRYFVEKEMQNRM